MSKTQKFWLFIAALLVLLGLGTELYQLNTGMVVTDLNNFFPWGLSVSGLEFFAGNGAGAILLICFVYIFRVHHLKPLVRVAAVCALANTVAGMVIILSDLGRVGKMYEMLLHPNLTSPLVWDVTILNIEALLAALFIYIQWQGARKGSNYVDNRSRIVAPIALFITVGFPTAAWIMTTQAGRAYWHSALLAPDYLVTGIVSGMALVVAAAALLYGAGEEYRAAYRSAAAFILVSVLLHFVFSANEILVRAWFGAGESLHMLELVFSNHGVIYGFEMGALLAGAMLFLSQGVRKRSAAVVVSMGLLLVGTLIGRFSMMFPAFNQTTLTIHPLGLRNTLWPMPVASGRYGLNMKTFITSWNYFPSFPEIAVFIGAFAFMGLLVMLFMAWLNRPQWRVKESP